MLDKVILGEEYHPGHDTVNFSNLKNNTTKMSGYKRKAYDGEAYSGEQRFFNVDDADEYDESEEMHTHFAGPQPYIPPVVEDPYFPDEYTGENVSVVDIGEQPYKRTALMYNPGYTNLAAGVRHFTFNEGGVNRELDVPRVYWGNFNFRTNADLRDFIHEYSSIEGDAAAVDAVFPNVIGPFTSFNERMATVEILINQTDFNFDGLRPIVPDIGYTAGVAAMWLREHLENAHTERKHCWYKAMVCMHCVFQKTYEDGATEYRRFLFDKMCESGSGTLMNTKRTEKLFKIVYNTTVELAYEKLDMRNCDNVPNIDSKFEFYAIRTVAITIFQYQPTVPLRTN